MVALVVAVGGSWLLVACCNGSCRGCGTVVEVVVWWSVVGC